MQIIKEKQINAVADTGADISVISAKLASSLQLPLHKTKIKIKPFGSKTLRCAGYCIGTVVCGDAVANLKIYAIKINVETLPSGQAAESLGIIKFNANPTIAPSPFVECDNRKATTPLRLWSVICTCSKG